MKTKLTLLGGAVAVVGAAVYWNARPAAGTAGGPDVAQLQNGVHALAGRQGQGRCQFPGGWKASYDYQGSVRSSVTVQGMPRPVETAQDYSAKLAFELLEKPAGDEWVLLGQFSNPSDALTKMHGPDLTTPFLVKVGAACDVRGFARLRSAPKKAAQVQQVAMHDLFVKDPGASSAEMLYENGTGVARAVFSIDANGTAISRSIQRYETAWRVKNTFQVTQSHAQATLNGHWLETFQSQEGISGGLVSSALSSLVLKKEPVPTAAVLETASRASADYAWENLLAGFFTESSAAAGNLSAVPAAERAYVEAMKDQTIETAFSELLAKADSKANIDEQWHEMVGYLNGHPEKIEEFAQGLTQDDFPENAKSVSYLVLNKTVHPQAREALVGLRENPRLNVGDRTRASLALATRKDVGVEVARRVKRDALTASSGDAESDFLARNALLHLGVLASVNKDDKEVFELARETVKSQLQAAGDDTYLLSPALGAAGNLGDTSLLSTVVGYTRHHDYHVRQLVPKALRGYPYATTEGIFVDWLARETHPDVKEEIFDVLFHQLATAQRQAGPGVVTEAIKHLQMKPMVLARQSIIHLIGPLKDTYPEVKVALIEQAPEEFRNQSGIFNQIANYLAPPELELALSRMPEFAHQYGAQAQQRAAQEVLEHERNLPRVRPLEERQ